VDNIVLFFIMLFFKSTGLGFAIRYELHSLYPKHFYKKNLSKNVIKRYFYFGFKHDINPLLFYTNIIYPLIAILTLIIATINLIYSCYYIVLIVSTIACVLTVYVFLLRIIFYYVDRKNRI
jgi:hypothetical protein